MFKRCGRDDRNEPEYQNDYENNTENESDNDKQIVLVLSKKEKQMLDKLILREIEKNPTLMDFTNDESDSQADGKEEVFEEESESSIKDNNQNKQINSIDVQHSQIQNDNSPIDKPHKQIPISQSKLEIAQLETSIQTCNVVPVSQDIQQNIKPRNDIQNKKCKLQMSQLQQEQEEITSSQLKELRNKLAQQQQLFQKSISFMKQQQNEIAKQEQNDNENIRQLIQLKSLSQSQNLGQQQTQHKSIVSKSNINIQFSNSKNVQMQNTYNQNPILNYNSTQIKSQNKFNQNNNISINNIQKANLKLVDKKLVGEYDDQIIFEINVNDINNFAFDNNRKSISVKIQSNYIALTQINKDSYFKWRYNILQQHNNTKYNQSLVMKLDCQSKQLYVHDKQTGIPIRIFKIANSIVQVHKLNDLEFITVQCIDGKKFQFNDNIEICSRWLHQFQLCGAKIKYI